MWPACNVECKSIRTHIIENAVMRDEFKFKFFIEIGFKILFIARRGVGDYFKPT